LIDVGYLILGLLSVSLWLCLFKNGFVSAAVAGWSILRCSGGDTKFVCVLFFALEGE
jgi:hypothetical protein